MTASMTALLLGHVLAYVPSTPPPTKEPAVEWWAGHQVTFGVRELLLRGRVVTRTETLLLARVRAGDDRLVLEETACAVRFRPIGSVQVSMDATAIPRHRGTYALRDGEYRMRSQVGWGDEDVDADGNPGMTIEVDAPVCSGEIYVAHQASTVASGARGSAGLTGNARVVIEQKVLGTSNRCLRMGAKDSTEVVRGPFAYRRVPDGSTCASLLASGWPIDAEAPRR